MANFYISDLHIGHENILRFDNRPFADVNEMNNKLIENWNARVRSDDTVYILGDFIWAKESEWPSIVGSLAGNKVLIRGNHDPKQFSAATRRMFQEITDLKEIKDSGKHVVMCHYPIPFFRAGFAPTAFMLYGHVHQTIEYEYIAKLRREVKANATCYGTPNGNFINVGCMMPYMDYTPRTLDLIDMEKSHCYNPFVYISSDDDIQRLTTNLFKNTTPKGSQTQDPFWDQTAAMLLKALVCYLHYEAPPDEQNFSMVMEMIRAGDVKEDNEEYQSVLDELFERLEERNPEHIALKYYRAYHSGSAKTLKSIQISLVSRLEKFNLDSLAGITQCDEMDLGQIGERKTAVFAVIPDNDSSFNFIVGMLYTQLFQQLYYQADSVHGGRLPVHVHFVMDEFANVALPDEFDKLLSTMRSREISVSIIIQNLAQLKALFEKQWESIVGNCDEFLYLGGNEQSTHPDEIRMKLGRSYSDYEALQQRSSFESLSGYMDTSGGAVPATVSEELAASISMQEQEKKRETLFGTIIGNGGDDDVRNNE